MQAQLPNAVGVISVAAEPVSAKPPMYVWQSFLLPLTEPSLQINVDPWQWLMPPFFPLHGSFPDAAEPKSSADAIVVVVKRNFACRNRAFTFQLRQKLIDMPTALISATQPHNNAGFESRLTLTSVNNWEYLHTGAALRRNVRD
ncbi:hypothetical protein ACQKGL_29185 [Ensifer adhaerens]|uniref:hypothetical protein n=1 Tax=Ensifer adhaerens TaxID=106592 RepID=UPI003CFED609